MSKWPWPMVSWPVSATVWPAGLGKGLSHYTQHWRGCSLNPESSFGPHCKKHMDMLRQSREGQQSGRRAEIQVLQGRLKDCLVWKKGGSGTSLLSTTTQKEVVVKGGLISSAMSQVKG